MYITFEDDKSTGEEEIKPTGDGARSERQDWTALRKLDADVAERVLGWTRYSKPVCPTDNRTINDVLYCPPNFPESNFNSLNVVPYYSSDIAAAMEIVNTAISLSPDNSVIKNLGFAQLRIYRYGDGTWHVAFTKRGGKGVTANTLPEAICRAALALVDGPTSEETNV